jgi:hypothetical protein
MDKNYFNEWKYYFVGFFPTTIYQLWALQSKALRAGKPSVS